MASLPLPTLGSESIHDLRLFTDGEDFIITLDKERHPKEVCFIARLGNVSRWNHVSMNLLDEITPVDVNLIPAVVSCSTGLPQWVYDAVNKH